MSFVEIMRWHVNCLILYHKIDGHEITQAVGRAK